MRTVAARTEVVDHFPVYGQDGFAKVSGLGPRDFEVTVFRDGEVVAAAVRIDEIADAPGEYRLRFVPDRAGLWEVEVAYAAGRQVYAGQYEVTHAAVVGGSRPPGWV